MVSFSFLLIVGKPALLVHVRCALIKVVHQLTPRNTFSAHLCLTLFNYRGCAAFQRFASVTQNITYFASRIQKFIQNNVELVHTQSQNDGAHDLFIKSADEKRKKKVYPCMEKWKCSVNLLFTKSLNGSEHRRQIQFSSSMGFGNETKWKLRLMPFSLIFIWCQRAFCFSLIVFYI